MLTVTVQVDADPSEVQDHLLGVVDRVRDFEERYQGRPMPLPAEITET